MKLGGRPGFVLGRPAGFLSGDNAFPLSPGMVPPNSAAADLAVTTAIGVRWPSPAIPGSQKKGASQARRPCLVIAAGRRRPPPPGCLAAAVSRAARPDVSLSGYATATQLQAASPRGLLSTHSSLRVASWSRTCASALWSNAWLCTAPAVSEVPSRFWIAGARSLPGRNSQSCGRAPLASRPCQPGKRG